MRGRGYVRGRDSRKRVASSRVHVLVIGTEIGTSVFVIVQIAEVLRVAVVGVVGRIWVERVEMGYGEKIFFRTATNKSVH